MADGEIKVRYHGYSGTKHNQTRNGDSGVSYAVLPGAVGFEEAREFWEAAGGNPDRYRCGHVHDCCACLFHYTINVTVSPSRLRTLVTQSWGINI